MAEICRTESVDITHDFQCGARTAALRFDHHYDNEHENEDLFLNRRIHAIGLSENMLLLDGGFW